MFSIFKKAFKEDCIPDNLEKAPKGLGLYYDKDRSYIPLGWKPVYPNHPTKHIHDPSHFYAPFVPKRQIFHHDMYDVMNKFVKMKIALLKDLSDDDLRRLAETANALDAINCWSMVYNFKEYFVEFVAGELKYRHDHKLKK